MNVQQILAMKSSNAVESIEASVRVAEAAQILSSKRIGALLVHEGENRVAGIVSERDIVRRLGETGSGCLDLPVSAIMTAEVVTATPGDSAVSVLERMTSGRFRHMPVVEDGELKGLISIGDVVKARMSEIELENASMATMLAG